MDTVASVAARSKAVKSVVVRSLLDIATLYTDVVCSILVLLMFNVPDITYRAAICDFQQCGIWT